MRSVATFLDRRGESAASSPPSTRTVEASGCSPPLIGPHFRTSVTCVNCSPSLDHAAGLFPVGFSQGGPCAPDRSISSIGALLPIAL